MCFFVSLLHIFFDLTGAWLYEQRETKADGSSINVNTGNGTKHLKSHFPPFSLIGKGTGMQPRYLTGPESLTRSLPRVARHLTFHMFFVVPFAALWIDYAKLP